MTDWAPTDMRAQLRDFLKRIVALERRTFPRSDEPGSVRVAAGPVPAGWLPANGAAVSRVTYESLFLAVGTKFGAGNGSTTFNLPTLAAPGAGLVWVVRT